MQGFDCAGRIRPDGKQDERVEYVCPNPVSSAMLTPIDPVAVRFQADECSRKVKRVERYEI